MEWYLQSCLWNCYELNEKKSIDDDTSTLVEVMAASHYLSQCWPRSKTPHGVTWPQGHNEFILKLLLFRFGQLFEYYAIFSGEVIFFFCFSPGSTNFALNRPATLSSTYGESVASKAVDGIITSDDSNICHSGQNDYSPWLKVQLAESIWVIQVEIANRYSNGTSEANVEM